MKLRNLLVLGALLLTGSASAAIVDGVRQLPAWPTATQELQFGEKYYLLNVKANKFFCGANSWDTQASAEAEGWPVILSKHLATDGSWDNKTVTMKDSVVTRDGKWLMAWFVSGSNIMYTDHASQADTLWTIEKKGDYYRLAASAENPAVNEFSALNVGLSLTAGGTILYSDLEDNENSQIDWSLIAETDYKDNIEAFLATNDLYVLAQSLKTQIDNAKEMGLDVATQEAVYANEAATTEEIEAAIAAVKEVIAKAEELAVDPLNPTDKTSSIVNPTMENTSGWTSIDGVQNRATHTNVTTGVYTSETLPAYEHWNGSAYTGKFYQTITGLPNGLYKLTAAVMGDQEPAAEGTGLYLYANENKTPVVSNVPAYYDVFTLVTDGTIEIGWTAEIAHSKWISSDTYSLLYYGNKGETTYAGAVAGMVQANLANFDGRESEVTAGTIDTYKATLNGLTATDLESLNAAIATITEANAAVQTNIDGWVKYNEEIIRGTSIANDKSYSQGTHMQTMAAYVRRTAPSILKSKALSTEDLLAEVAKLTQMIEDAIRNSLVANSDVTDMFLTNARYDDGTTGWLGNWTAVAYGCMEAYELEWDAYQIVKDAPVGVYEVSLQGFYRVSRGAEAYTKYQNGQQTCPGHVYVNNHLSEVKCVFDEPVKHDDGYIYEAIGTGPESNPNAFVGEDGDSIFFPNDMKTAGEAFTAGMYVSAANGLVAQQGEDLRIGVKGKKQSATWVIWDNFKMIYRGKQIAYTLPYLQEAVEAAAVTLTEPMDKDTKALLQTAKTNAEAFLNSTDEDAVFEALVQIYAANDSVTASAELFAELKEKANELQNAIMLYQATATEDAMNAATALLVQMMEALEGNSTKEEAQAMIAQVETVIVNLVIGDPTDASDDNAKDFTSLLSCPSFEDIDGNGSAEGWTGANGGTGSGAYEFYEKTFDLYQTLTNIPNGTYRIEVSAYERIGASVNDYALYTAGKDTATTFIYGASGEATYQKAVSRVSSAAILSNDAFGIADCAAVDTLKDVEVGADSITWVPNKMASAVTFFNDYSEYQNTVYAEVTDGTLTIGIKKEAQATYDWVMMDNWKLYYLGTNSQFKPEGIENVVLGNGAAVVGREIFTLGGAKVNKMEQGVYILRNIHADGTVTVKKVIK